MANLFLSDVFSYPCFIRVHPWLLLFLRSNAEQVFAALQHEAPLTHGGGGGARFAQVVRRELNEGKGDLMDESLSGDSQEAGFDALGFHDDQSVDKLLSRLKVDQS